MKIEIFGYYYYRGENHVPRRITIIEKGANTGFFWCVEGHMTMEEIKEKKPDRFLIHQNRVIQ